MNVPSPATAADYINAYMDEYYDSLSEKNEEIGRFLYESQQARAPGKLLDVACGPSAFYWSLFSPNVGEFHGIDVREDSIDYLRGILATSSEDGTAPRYHEVARWHGLVDVAATTFVQETAKKFRQLTAHDITTRWPYEDASFAFVVSCFGMDHVETPEQFMAVLHEAQRVLETGGTLTLVTLCETQSWQCGDETFACLHTTAESLRVCAAKAGFHVEFLEERLATTAVDRAQGYEKMLFFRGVKI